MPIDPAYPNLNTLQGSADSAAFVQAGGLGCLFGPDDASRLDLTVIPWGDAAVPTALTTPSDGCPSSSFCAASGYVAGYVYYLRAQLNSTLDSEDLHDLAAELDSALSKLGAASPTWSPGFGDDGFATSCASLDPKGRAVAAVHAILPSFPTDSLADMTWDTRPYTLSRAIDAVGVLDCEQAQQGPLDVTVLPGGSWAAAELSEGMSAVNVAGADSASLRIASTVTTSTTGVGCELLLSVGHTLITAELQTIGRDVVGQRCGAAITAAATALIAART